jgi:hypothetical protein
MLFSIYTYDLYHIYARSEKLCYASNSSLLIYQKSHISEFIQCVSILCFNIALSYVTH